MKLLCIGDSNTFGYDPRSYIGSRYPAEVRWTDRLTGFDVVNRGVNGMTVPRDHSAVVSQISRKDPDLVMIMLGTNDLLGGVSAEETAERMEAFIRSVRETEIPILLIAPPHLRFGEWVMDGEQVEESLMLGGLYRELAGRNGCMFADAGEWDIDVTFDGVHFSPEGHAQFARRLEEVLKREAMQIMGV